MKFCKRTKNGVPQSILLYKFTFREIQDGGGGHSEIHFNGHPGYYCAYPHTFGTASKSDVSEQRAVRQRSD